MTAVQYSAHFITSTAVKLPQFFYLPKTAKAEDRSLLLTEYWTRERDLKLDSKIPLRYLKVHFMYRIHIGKFE